MTHRRCAAAILLVVLGSSAAHAQQTVAPVLVRAAPVSLSDRHLANLRRLAAIGDGERIAGAASELLDDLTDAKFNAMCCDYRRDFFLVIFVAPDGTGTPQVVPVLLHDPMPDSSALPGIGRGTRARLYELFVSEPDDSASIRTTYTVAHEESPAEKQLGDFAATVIGKLALPVATIPHGAKPAAHSIMVRFSRVVLPEPGRITSRYLVTYADLARHLKTAAASVDADHAAVPGSGEAGNPTTAACVDLSATIHATFDRALAAAPCGPWIGDAAACTKRLTAAVELAASGYFASSPPCAAAIGGNIVQAFLDAAADVKAISATSAIANAAPVRYGFGLAFGYIGHIELDVARPRAQLQNGRLTANPFARTLIIALVNLTPWGYDAQTFRPSFRERARLFTGPVLTPNYGVAAGFAYQINRYLGVNAGYARLWFDTPKSGETLDRVPSAANAAAPFDLASTGAWFIGLSYSLK